MIRLAVIVAVLAFAVAFPLFRSLRGYPWSMALLISAAIAALVYSSIRSLARLLDLRDRDQTRIGSDPDSDLHDKEH